MSHFDFSFYGAKLRTSDALAIQLPSSSNICLKNQIRS